MDTVITYTNLNDLCHGDTFFAKINNSYENPFRIVIKKAIILIQLKKYLNSNTMALFLKTDFFEDEVFTVPQKTITEARATLIRMEESPRSLYQLDLLPGKIKLLNIILKYYNTADKIVNHTDFTNAVSDFILSYYYDLYDDTIVEFNEHTLFLKDFVTQSTRYEVEGNAFYLKQFRVVEETIRDFIHTDKCVFLSGKAGTGKTTTIEKIIDSNTDKKILVIAPTNAAVMRIRLLITSTTVIIKTIHSAFSSVINNKYDIIVVDESSMLSTPLVGMVHELFTATGASKIIFVGDYRQLPPVEKGNFFKVAVTKYADTVKHTELKKVYRQESSDILRLANVFSTPEICNHRLSIDQICEIVKSDSITVNEYDGYGTKMRKMIKLTSEYNMNHHMVAYSNKTVNDINRIVYRMVTNNEFNFKDHKKFLCKKLKLRATVNNTDRNIMMYTNNQYVEVVDWTALYVTVKDIFTDEEITLPIRNLNSDFTLGYCSTAHTAQGLGFNVVDFFMSNYNYRISKELYYTSITRAKKQLNLIKPQHGSNHICYITDDIRETFY